MHRSGSSAFFKDTVAKVLGVSGAIRAHAKDVTGVRLPEVFVHPRSPRPPLTRRGSAMLTAAIRKERFIFEGALEAAIRRTQERTHGRHAVSGGPASPHRWTSAALSHDRVKSTK